MSTITPPSPNCPYSSDPQHFTSPFQGGRRCDTLTPTATAVLPVPRSIAVVGGVLVFVLLPPSPNCPLSHPALQVGVVKDGTCMCTPVPLQRPFGRSEVNRVVEGALMSVGLIIHTGPPSPNCPPTSLPQHFKSPLSRMAQVCWVPEDSATAVRPVPRSIAVLEGASVFVGLRGPCRPTIAHLSILVPSPTLHVTVVKDGAVWRLQ